APRAQQTAGAALFTGGAGPEPGIQRGMGSALAQVNTQHLREGSLAASAVLASEVGGVLGRIRQIGTMSIDGHQTQSPQEGSGRLAGGHRLTNPAKQYLDGTHSQLIASVGQGTVSG